MSYYILPKINNTINVNPSDGNNDYLNPYISHSLFNYYNELQLQIHNTCNNTNFYDVSQNTYKDYIKLVNPYEYIFSKVPGSKFSVSKFKPKTNLFYDFLEISITLNIFDPYKTNILKTLHLTNNNNDTIECFEMLRENYSDEIVYYDKINDETLKLIGDAKYDFLFFGIETDDLHQYIISVINYVMIILRNQELGGSCVIQISHIFHKPIVDILYLLSSLYDKVYVLKPNSNNVTTFDKYIICKNFHTYEQNATYLKLSYYRLLVFLKKLDNKHICSILDYEIPYYFTTKIVDMNIIIGQQQLESLNMIINILKNKNKEEKIEIIKKSNIQKSISWCEKYKIPFNKFSEKTNIFLPITNTVEVVDTII